MEKKNNILASFLDIKATFNNLKLKSSHNALACVRIRDTLLSWMDAMLSNRIINSSIGDVSIRKSLTRRTPHGGVLSPLEHRVYAVCTYKAIAIVKQ